jgi:hypothetical protein
MFLEDLTKLLDCNSENYNKFKVRKNKNANAFETNVAYFPFNRKGQQEEFRKKIYDLDLPGKIKIVSFVNSC